MKNVTTFLSREANDRLSRKLWLLSAVLPKGDSTRWCHQKRYSHFTVFSATSFPLSEFLGTPITSQDPRALVAAETLNKE